VLTAWAADGPDDAPLVLAGPDVSAVTDDPEGSTVFAECRAQWSDLPSEIRGRVHLVSIPIDDVDENAIIINALQRRAHVVVQKSLVEGFGLTVTEAMWKARPVVASRVGGIQDQIVHDQHGLLIEPHDLDACAAATARLLADHGLAERLGTAGRARVRDHFLGDRHLTQYVDLLASLSTAGADRGPTGPVVRRGWVHRGPRTRGPNHIVAAIEGVRPSSPRPRRLELYRSGRGGWLRPGLRVRGESAPAVRPPAGTRRSE